MAYTVPITAVAGATFTATQWNQSVRDNLQALWVYTTAGQIVYSTAADTLAALAKPSVDSVLKNTSGGVPSWKALSDFVAWPYTLAGQIAYANSPTALSVLSKPSVDSILKMTNAGTPSWKAIADFFPWLYTAAGQILYSTSPTAASPLDKPLVDSLLKNTSAGVPSWKAISDIAPYSAIGDLLYASAPSTVSALAKPSVDSILKMTGAGVPSWLAVSSLQSALIQPSGASPWTNASYAGGSKAVGTYTLTPNGFNASIPSTARALLLTVSAKWAAASDGSLVNLAPLAGGGNNCVLVRSQIANTLNDNTGLVPMSSGQFDIYVAGADCTALTVLCWGYAV